LGEIQADRPRHVAKNKKNAPAESLSKTRVFESRSYAPPEPLPDSPECGLIEHEEMSEISTMTFFLCLAGLAILIFGLSRISIWVEQRGAVRRPSSRSIGSLDDVTALAATDRVVATEGISSKNPEWITAIATALQTIAVIATLAVAYREWTSHELASRQAKIDNVLKLYADKPSVVTDSRNYVNRLNIILLCEKSARQQLSEQVRRERQEDISHITETICDPEHMFRNQRGSSRCPRFINI
jgi:hypothetical protein